MYKRLGIRTKMIVPMVIMGILLAGVASWYTLQLSTEEMIGMAVRGSEILVAQTAEVREYYTKNVVKRTHDKGIAATHDYENQPGAIPLPATMIHELNQTLSEREGVTLRLYSEYPFPFRKDGGARDNF